MENPLIHICPNCNTVLKYDMETKKWKCENCGKDFDFEKSDVSIENDNTDKKILSEFFCTQCKSKFVTDNDIKSCIYCDSTDLKKSIYNDNFKSDFILPFTNDLKSAKNIFSTYLKRKVFSYKEFKVKKVLDKIIGVYIPISFYDCESNGIVEANCKVNTTWKSGNYKYIKVDRFIAMRGGNVVFENIPICMNNNYKDDVIDNISSFEFEKLKEFDDSYLNGYILSKATKSVDDLSRESILKAKENFKKEMLNDINGYDEVSYEKDLINLNMINQKCILIPVWFLNVKYKGKIFSIILNDQTKEILTDIPVSKFKMFILWFIIFIPIFIIFYLLFNLKVIL